MDSYEEAILRLFGSDARRMDPDKVENRIGQAPKYKPGELAPFDLDYDYERLNMLKALGDGPGAYREPNDVDLDAILADTATDHWGDVSEYSDIMQQGFESLKPINTWQSVFEATIRNMLDKFQH